MKFFEAINENDESIVIDDTFKNLEIIDHFPLSECRFVPAEFSGEQSEKYGHYEFPRTHEGAFLSGISVERLSGVPAFGLETFKDSIYFFDKSSNVPNLGLYPIRRHDIESKSEVYLFGFIEQKPSTHGVGLEIYDDDGNILFSSNKKYLNVIGCGSDDTQTIPFSDKPTIVSMLGTDKFLKIRINYMLGADGVDYNVYPKIEVGNNSIKISRLDVSVYYVPFGSDSEDFSGWHEDFVSWYNFGWLVGEVEK